jgi:serine-type D-Ala-D-Ala carboxypeptidase/endopeptidase
MGYTLLTFSCVVALMLSTAVPKVCAAAPQDSEIRQILVQRVDQYRQSVGIVVGVIDSKGRRIVAYGKLDQNDQRILNGDTIFEIGSVTKVFTALLLADMVQHGEVALDDPVSKYLPKDLKMPERGGHSITLRDLATHTSGLPRLPTNLSPKNAANPYADYSIEQLDQFLSTYQLTRDIGAQYEYSNLGYGLLGYVLSRRAGTDYETLVRSRICEPLKMASTRIALTPEMKTRLAVGHNEAMAPVPNWEFSTLAGAGALRSDTNDLLVFLAANLGYIQTSLAPAMASMLKVRRPTGVPGMEVALGWHLFTGNGNEIVWHNGGTGGYRSFIGYDPKTGVGVVVLSNAETSAGVDDIGHHLLDVSFPLMAAPKEHKEIAVNPHLFDAYVGRYQLAPNFILSITRESDHLFVQATGQQKFELFPESDRDYFLKAVDAQITFEVDSHDRGSGLVLHQNGLDQYAGRVE